MFPKIRLVNGRVIIVGSHAAGLRVAPVTGVEKRAGTLKICSVITGTWRVRQGTKGRPTRLCRLPHLLHLRLEPRRRHILVLCLPVLLLTRLLGLLLSLSRKWTRLMIRTILLFFERLWRCLRIATFRRVFSMKFGKLFHRTGLRRGKLRKFLENKSC